MIVSTSPCLFSGHECLPLQPSSPLPCCSCTSTAMENLIKDLANTALDAASSLLHNPKSSKPHSFQDQHLDIVDRSTWAEVVGGQEKGNLQGSESSSGARHHSQDSYDKKTFQKQQHDKYVEPSGGKLGPPSAQNNYKNQVLDGQDEDAEGWQAVGSSHHHVTNHYQSCPPPKQYHKVPDEQWQKFKKHPSEQEYAGELDSSVNIDPTNEELGDLSAACSRLWELDLNRLTPGQDYEINCGEGKKVYQKEDMARNSLFHHVKREVFGRPTYARFYSLLDNYTANEWQQEIITTEEKQEEISFVEEISRTAPVQYLFRYLVAKGKIPESFQEFKQHLKSLWFDMYARGGTDGTSCAFEHVFVGEIKNRSGREVSGFHNWIKFYLEEANGRVDYHGYILPRRRSHSLPDAHTQLLSVQFEWNSVLKPVSSTFVGVSPEFEFSLYTLCFYVGEEDNFVQVGPYAVNIKCYHLGRDKIGSAFPIVEE